MERVLEATSQPSVFDSGISLGYLQVFITKNLIFRDSIFI